MLAEECARIDLGRIPELGSFLSSRPETASMGCQTAVYEPNAPRERRALRSRVNQMQRALAAVYLAVDGLSPRDRVVVLHTALQESMNELSERTYGPPSPHR